jgi:chemotaxis protein MotD
VPHVAFESNIQAFKAPPAPSVRPSDPDGSGTPSPFDSLIDDSLPPPTDSRARASDDTPPASRADSAQTQPVDRPDRSQKTDDPPKSADATQNAPAKDNSAKTEDAKAPKDSKASKDAKGGQDDDKSTTDGTKAAAGDAAPADAGASADAIPAANAVPNPVPAAVAVAVMAAPSATTDSAPASGKDGTIDAAGAQKAQPDLLAALQAEVGGKVDGKIDGKAEIKGGTEATDKTAKKTAGKTTDAAKAKPAAPAMLEAAAKTQSDGEPEKDSTLSAHVGVAADVHRGATPDTQVKSSPDDKTAAPKPAADIATLTMPPAPTQQAQATAAAPATPAAPAQAAPETPVPLNGIGIEIASKVLSGKNQFDIRLDPPELGRIHVRLDVDNKGNVITHMVADRTDTLDMLRRDSAGLERALQDAGLKTSDNGMQFSLRDQSANQQQSNNRGHNTAHIVVNDEQVIARGAVTRDYSRYSSRAGGLDISV